MLEAALEELAPPGTDSSAERSLVWSIGDSDTDSEEEETAVADARHKSTAIVITAQKNVWSRQARRAAKIAPPAAAGEQSGGGPSDPRAPNGNAADKTAAAAPTPTAAPLLELRIEIERASPGPPSCAPSTAQAPDIRTRLAGWWIRGEERDRPAVEGLWGFLTRRVGDECRRRRGPGAPSPSKGDAGAGEGTEADGDAGVGGTSRRKRRKVA